jgi:uncharacterized membrane protein
MKTLLSAITISHVLAGIIALLIGLVPMIAQKGGKLHNWTGLVYVWCMIYVAVTALLLCTLQPFRMGRLFLTGVAVLSFYLCVSGWRATKQKHGAVGAFDRGLVYAALAVGVAMMGFGTYLLLLNGFQFLPVVFAFFGFLLARNAQNDWQQMRQPTEKRHWYYQHLMRMGQSYIATFTAALVNNVDRFAPDNAPDWFFLIFWTAPALIGTTLINRTVAHYKQKVGAKQPQLA